MYTHTARRASLTALHLQTVFRGVAVDPHVPRCSCAGFPPDDCAATSMRFSLLEVGSEIELICSQETQVGFAQLTSWRTCTLYAHNETPRHAAHRCPTMIMRRIREMRAL